MIYALTLYVDISKQFSKLHNLFEEINRIIMTPYLSHDITIRLNTLHKYMFSMSENVLNTSRAHCISSAIDAWQLDNDLPLKENKCAQYISITENQIDEIKKIIVKVDSISTYDQELIIHEKTMYEILESICPDFDNMTISDGVESYLLSGDDSLLEEIIQLNDVWLNLKKKREQFLLSLIENIEKINENIIQSCPLFKKNLIPIIEYFNEITDQELNLSKSTHLAIQNCENIIDECDNLLFIPYCQCRNCFKPIPSEITKIMNNDCSLLKDILKICLYADSTFKFETERCSKLYALSPPLPLLVPFDDDSYDEEFLEDRHVN